MTNEMNQTVMNSWFFFFFYYDSIYIQDHFFQSIEFLLLKGFSSSESELSWLGLQLVAMISYTWWATLTHVLPLVPLVLENLSFVPVD